MADRGDVLDRVTDLMEDKSTTTRTRLENWVGFVMSEMKQHGLLGSDATTTVPTVAGTATYNLPAATDVVDTVYLEDSGTDPLVYLPGDKFAEFLAADDDETGVPRYYTLPLRATGSTTPTIRLFPVPGAVYTLRVNYQADFAALDDDTDVVDLKADAFTTVVWGLYRIGVRFLEDQDLNAAFTEWKDSLRAAKWAQFGRIGRTYLVRPDLN